MTGVRRVAVIGAGGAGLAAARHLSTDGRFDCVVFEKTDQLGGTWVYRDEVGNDQYGQPVHSSMYKSLRTNLPKEVMGFPDFPIPENELSYLPAKDILSFLDRYAEHFNIKRFIKYHHPVRRVSPRLDGRWDVEVHNLRCDQISTEEFDVVMVCNGHYATPFTPVLPGIESFKGHQIHSHDYRVPNIFKRKRVVVVGAGPSGMDLTLEISNEAKSVIMSHHWPEAINTVFPDNVRMTSDIKIIRGNTFYFKDGTTFEADSLFYCTGYRYDFPFFSPDCGITVEENYVQPLYKHLINIKQPTMCLVGLPFYVCAFSLFDLQVRFFLKTLTGEFKLPSPDEMASDAEREFKNRLAKGLDRRKAHMMGPMQKGYYDELAKLGGLKPLPPVLSKLHNESSRRFLEDLGNYRNDVYSIIDENNYVKMARQKDFDPLTIIPGAVIFAVYRLALLQHDTHARRVAWNGRPRPTFLFVNQVVI